jgi:hypothetical protein
MSGFRKMLRCGMLYLLPITVETDGVLFYFSILDHLKFPGTFQKDSTCKTIPIISQKLGNPHPLYKIPVKSIRKKISGQLKIFTIFTLTTSTEKDEREKKENYFLFCCHKNPIMKL